MIDAILSEINTLETLIAETPEECIIERKSLEARLEALKSELFKSETDPRPLPCPFCGSRNIVCHEGSTSRWWVVVCENCGAQGPEVRRYMDGDADARALREWNLRKEVSHGKES